MNDEPNIMPRVEDENTPDGQGPGETPEPMLDRGLVRWMASSQRAAELHDSGA